MMPTSEASESLPVAYIVVYCLVAFLAVLLLDVLLLNLEVKEARQKQRILALRSNTLLQAMIFC